MISTALSLGRRAAFKDCTKEMDFARAWLRAGASLLPCTLVPETCKEFSWAFWVCVVLFFDAMILSGTEM